MITGARIAAIGLLVIGLLIVCLTYDVWAAAFLGLLFALCLNGPAGWIRSKWNIPAWAATSLTILMVLTVLTGLGFAIGPPLVGQADEMGRSLPKAMEKSVKWLEEQPWGRSALRQVEAMTGLNGERDLEDGQESLSQKGASNSGEEQPQGGNADHAKAIILPALHTLGTMASVTVWTIMLVLFSLVVTLYVALDPDVYRRGVVWMIPVEHEAVATLTMTRMCVALRWWMLGRLASMVVIGLLTSLGMWLIGIPSPLALGALAGLLSFVPNIGPIVSAAPGIVLAVPGGPWMVLSALGVYVAAQVVESNLVSPLVDQYTVATPPAVLVVAQVIMGVLAGAWGLLIATPLLVVVLVLTQQLYVLEYLKKPIKAIGSTEDETPDHSPSPLPATS